MKNKRNNMVRPAGWGKDFGSILTAVVCVHLVFTLFYTGHFVLFSSSLPLLFSPDYFREEKNELMRGGDYRLAKAFAGLPLDANYLIVPQMDVWFINYYLFPRKLFIYPGVALEEEVGKVPAAWLKQKKIEYIIFYQRSGVRVVKLK